MFYHYILILLQFLLIHSLEIDISKKQKNQLAIIDYSTIENKTGSQDKYKPVKIKKQNELKKYETWKK